MKKTKKERKIEILKDALSQIKKRVFIAQPGTICYLNDTNYLDQNDSKGLQSLLKQKFKEKEAGFCEVCARGALLASTIAKENNFTLFQLESASGSFQKSSPVDVRLMRLFSAQQIALMENAFETDHCILLVDDSGFDEDGYHYAESEYLGINYSLLTKKLALKSVAFGLKYEEPEDRLIAIFKNAIKNEGIFKP